MKILLATANTHKVEEISAMLDGGQVEVLSLREFPEIVLPEETGDTMRENARLKAQHCARASGLPSLADDSGIEVDFLNGAPGVLSARWVAGSDQDRTSALLDKLGKASKEKRTARYRCALCLVFQGGKIIETEATCEGKITMEPKGQNGFGYDPIFEITNQTHAPHEYSGLTMAQVPPEIKAQISHRARALEKLREFLNESGL
jgi:XTP/dITP diphosphohydrolase